MIYKMIDSDYENGYYNEDLSFYLETNASSEMVKEIVDVANWCNREDLDELHERYGNTYDDIFDQYSGECVSILIVEILKELNYEAKKISIQYDDVIEW